MTRPRRASDADLAMLARVGAELASAARTFPLTGPIEAINIADDGRALVGMVDFRAGEVITIERQAAAGTTGIFGWEAHLIAHYRDRSWNADTETIFRANGHRYITLNLPRRDDA